MRRRKKCLKSVVAEKKLGCTKKTEYFIGNVKVAETKKSMNLWGVNNDRI